VPAKLLIQGVANSKTTPPEARSPGSSSGTLEKPDLVPLRGKRVGVVVFSHYPSDPRPRREAEALAALGMKVDVISLRQDRGEPSREVFNGVNILRIPLQHKRGGKFSYFFEYGSFFLAASFLLASRSLIRRYRLIHVHNMPDFLIFASLVPKVFGAKVILDLHDPMPELIMAIYGLKEGSFGVRLLKRLEQWSTAFADQVLTPNVAFLKLFARRSCPETKLRVVMNSPDETIFKYRRTEDGAITRDSAKPFVIMYHGSLVERHGVDIAINALGLVKHTIPYVELRIYGQKTPFLEQTLDSVADSGLRESVRYLGSRPLEQIVEAIDECDVGIIPNRRNAFTELNMPTRIFEYLCRGKSVIAPSTSGIRDYFKEGELIFCDRGDADELAQKLCYVFSNPDEVREIVRRGQAVYLANRWNQEQAKFVTLTVNLLTGKSFSLPQAELSPG